MEHNTIHYYGDTNSPVASQRPPMKLAELFARKTHIRENKLVVAKSNDINPVFLDSTGASEFTNNQGKFQETFSADNLQSQINGNTDPFHQNVNHDWTKVKKKSKNHQFSIFSIVGSFLKNISLKRVVPVAVGVSILFGGFAVLRSLGNPDQLSEAGNVDEGVEEIIRQDEREIVLLELSDKQVSASMDFLKKASVSFESSPAGDVKLIDSANDLQPTRQTLQNNMNLYTSIYLYEELSIYHLDTLRDLNVENNDLRATLFSLFELEKRAYDRGREINAQLTELESLYDSDRNRKLEVRAVANENIVQLNQTQAEIQILIKRLDRFFVD